LDNQPTNIDMQHMVNYTKLQKYQITRKVDATHLQLMQMQYWCKMMHKYLAHSQKLFISSQIILSHEVKNEKNNDEKN